MGVMTTPALTREAHRERRAAARVTGFILKDYVCVFFLLREWVSWLVGVSVKRLKVLRFDIQAS